MIHRTNLIPLTIGLLLAASTLTLWAAGPQPAVRTGQRGAGAGNAEVLLRFSLLRPSEEAFRDIYGTPPVLGVELDLGRRTVGGWLEAGWLKRSGKLTLTGEETRLTVVPIEAGLRVRLGKGRWVPYLGIGAGYYKFKERNVLGNVTDSGFGPVGVGGLRFARGHLIFDVKAKYTSCRIEPNTAPDGVDSIRADIGGLALSLGLGLAL